MIFDDAADDFRPPELYGSPPKHIFPFHISTAISKSSSFAAVGKSMFCVGGHKVNGKGKKAPPSTVSIPPVTIQVFGFVIPSTCVAPECTRPL